MQLEEYQDRLDEAVNRIKQNIGILPYIGIIAGTGLGELIEDIEITGSIGYEKLLFPVSTVDSHKGVLSWGSLNEVPVFILQGRFHLYEGYSPWEIALPIRALSSAGMQTLILTNAAGGLDLTYEAGDIMIITDHINATGANPLVGAHQESWGDRFPDMSQVWDKELIGFADDFADKTGTKLHKGVYVAIKGPSLETPAETRMYRNFGAQAIGMSTVLEAITAVQSGVRLFGLSAITNVNDPDDMAKATLEDIVTAAKQASSRMGEVIKAVCSGIACQ